MAALDLTALELGQELRSLIELARAERLSLSLYRFPAHEQVVLEAYPASDFRAQHEGALSDVIRQMTTTVEVSGPQVEDPIDAGRLGEALERLFQATADLTIFVNFLHPAGSESSCRVEVLRPTPLQVVVSRLAPDPVTAIEGAVAALADEAALPTPSQA